MKNKGSFTLGALIGGLCGGVTALLFAPKKGKEMRKDLCKKYDEVTERAKELVENAKEESDELMKKACRVVSEAKEAAEDLICSAKKRYRR